VYLGAQVKRRAVGSAGVEVEEVLPGGPAAMAGLRQGDTITALAGRTTTGVDLLAELLEAADTQVSAVYSDAAGDEHITAIRLAGKESNPLSRWTP
jgi:S1-C subfamily serine protease